MPKKSDAVIAREPFDSPSTKSILMNHGNSEVTIADG